MKKTLLIAILVLATGWLAGCSFVYEEYAYHPRHSRIVVAPPVEVIEVVPVRPHYPRHWPHRHRHW